ncbi:MAG TPA: type II toxin-antitoxin system ParD family antitoxin [Acetobacteraceae bacterium]|nr:type II toxin-antitoxin system ParD family antitoxin [Acetobacteraceae bacterium]
MTVVTLTPEQERLAQAALATGRYGDTDAVIDAALRLLEEQERERAAFVASIHAARERAEREGYVSLEEVMAVLDADEAAAREAEAARRTVS